MPSFDIVSQVDWHEVTNAIDQTNREVSNRFDFKGSDARVAQDGESLIIHGDDEYRIGQVKDILEIRLTKRGIDIRCLLASAVRESSGGKAQQELKVRAGIDGVLAKKLVQVVKASKMKVQSSIQSEQVRITGKKRDDLQSIIKIIEQEELTLPLQFVNFRD
ncbi:MAG: YajQ family cyclic di-GMP-binding protein [Acidiferrobacteraceae bacterium]|nr:YajQ family cyclic di-GMP-binding protein [Acidiferrobacteraceae bacterium]|tara:strand:+ start:10274 stop:10759 length:486 start_codon:yes stop_codon:yes gene_type:complete